MSRRQAHLVTLIGCMISLVSFCFLPYLVVPFSSFSFTGLQLVILEDRIPLPNYVVIVGYPLELQNIPFIWAQLLLVILMLLGAIRDVFLTRRTERAGHGYAKGIIIVASLTLFLLLCSCTNTVLNKENPLSGVTYGSIFTPGFWGLLLGMMVALIGSMIALRAKNRKGVMGQ